jgi:hypothetical protein
MFGVLTLQNVEVYTFFIAYFSWDSKIVPNL